MSDDDEARPNTIVFTNEPLLIAEAVFMTSIRCPNCRLRFEIEGNCDREIIMCPSCNKTLAVRLR